MTKATRLAALLAATGRAAAVRTQVDRAMLAQVRCEGLRLATVAFRPATWGGPLCSCTAPLTGLVLHDARQDEPPLTARC